jgi:hypothetical protein
VTPTLAGRLQTRLLLAAVVGLPVALLVALLPGGVTVPGAVLTFALITALGMGWECVYHLVQQQRWDGDWPGWLALGVGAVEALVAHPVLGLAGASPGFPPLMLLFGTTWVAMWAAGRGVLSVFLPHWRHQGARVVPEHLFSDGRVRRTTSPASRPAARRPSLPKVSVPKPSLPKVSVPKPSMPQPALHRDAVPERSRGLLGDLLRPTRQQLVVLGGLAAMVVGLLLLAPLVGPRGHHDAPPMAMQPQHHAAERPPKAAGVQATTWNTQHRVRPESLRFGAVGVDDTVGDVRMTSTGVLGTPRSGHAAWFAQGAAPGQRGPAVFIGDSADVFSRLDEAHKGQQFTTARSDGSVVRFVVDDVVSVDAGQFPSRRVYGHSLKPLARLIGYDTSTGRNVIVFAHAVAVSAMAARS